MWDAGSWPVSNGALQANVFIDLPETIRKDDPLHSRGFVWRKAAFLLWLSRGVWKADNFGPRSLV